MSPADRPDRTGVDAVLHELLRLSFGMFPDHVGSVCATSIKTHTAATDVQLLVVDLDQEVLTSSDGTISESVEWSAAGQAFREQQPVVERRADGRRLWVPVLDSAERVAVLGLVGWEGEPLDDWITVASLLGELIVTKARYGDHLTDLRRQEVATIAAEMRWSLLPPLTFSSPVVGISGILRPSYGVAGDAFDYAVREGHAVVGLFDAMGHGLLAARVANLAIGAFRAGRRTGRLSDEILTEMDAMVDEQHDSTVFVTAQIVDLDLATGVAQVHTAGHPPPIVFSRDTKPRVVEVRPGLPLGLGLAPIRYEPAEVQLQPGDALLMVSDGMYEAKGANGSRYGWDRMLGAVQDRIDAGDSNPEVLRRVARDVLAFHEDGPLDDMTAAIVRWRPDADGLVEPPSAGRVHDATV